MVENPTHSVMLMAFSPKGTVFAAALFNAMVQLYLITNGSPRYNGQFDGYKFLRKLSLRTMAIFSGQPDNWSMLTNLQVRLLVMSTRHVQHVLMAIVFPAMKRSSYGFNTYKSNCWAFSKVGVDHGSQIRWSYLSIPTRFVIPIRTSSGHSQSAYLKWTWFM